MVAAQQSPELTPSETPPDPGKRLRDLRVKHDMSLKEVASRLHLRVRTVEHIEADDYEALPAPTFVRGYLRGYARLLEVSPDPIVEAYDNHQFDPPPLVADISSVSQAKSSDFSVRLATYLIATAIVVLVGIWWQNQQRIPLGSSDVSAISEIAGADEADVREAPTDPLASVRLTQESPPPPGVDWEGTAAVAAVVAASAAQPVADAPEVQPEPAPVVDDLRLDISGASETQLTEPSAGFQAAAALAAGAPETATPAQGTAARAPTPVSAEAAPSRLRIVFRHESWTEIYTSDGRRLYYDLAKSGESIDVSGVAPFKVLLGYADGITVELNGEQFDYTSFIDRGVAQFTLGEEPPVMPAPVIAESRALPHSSQQR